MEINEQKNNIITKFNDSKEINNISNINIKSEEYPISTDIIGNLVTSDNFKDITLILDKFPGFIHVSFFSIENFPINNSDSLSLNVNIQGKQYTQNEFQVKNFIKPDLYWTIPIYKSIKSSIKIEISVKYSIGTELHALLELKDEDLTEMHNNIIEKKLYFGQNNIFCNVFKSAPLNDSICKFYCSYIPEIDIKMFKIIPNSSKTLSNWISFRRIAFDLMFEGFLNVKSEYFSFNWHKKYIKWYGYKIYVLDIQLKSIEEIIDLSVPEPAIELFSKKIIRFNLQGRIIELECLDIVSFKKCANALCTIFPHIMSFF